MSGKIIKPMLADPAPENLDRLRFPVLASPKLDGIRAFVHQGQLLTRSLKPIPNAITREQFRHLEGYDGELIVGSPHHPLVFNKTTSGVMSREGNPNATFYVFDHVSDGTWGDRIKNVTAEASVEIVPQHECTTVEEIMVIESKYLALGYEGLMLRDPYGAYKYGRATTREGWLMKLKRFADAEAEVIGYEERMHNANPATRNALGETERSSHKENMVPMETLGALIVRDLKTGCEFNIGSGFDDAERSRWWSMPDRGMGRIVKYRHFPIGVLDKPRFPTFIGERSKLDM